MWRLKILIRYFSLISHKFYVHVISRQPNITETCNLFPFYHSLKNNIDVASRILKERKKDEQNDFERRGKPPLTYLLTYFTWQWSFYTERHRCENHLMNSSSFYGICLMKYLLPDRCIHKTPFYVIELQSHVVSCCRFDRGNFHIVKCFFCDLFCFVSDL